MIARKRTAVLISGRGSNMRALVEAAKAEDYPAEIVLVISNVADAAGLHYAEGAGVPHRTVSHQDYPTREDFDEAIDEILHEAEIDIVCLAGFMRVLSPAFVKKWEGRLINIHPSLLPLFKGIRVHEQAVAAGVRVSGCTVHFVAADVDAGAIIAQTAVPVEHDDTAESLSSRVLHAEHRLYPHALRLLAGEHVKLENGRAIFAG
jgi:phosphoribosylglycinamide formyltransferase 1